MSDETKTRPVKTLRDGDLKAAIWENESENGPFHSVTFGRTYTDPKTQEPHDSDSFSGSQLLRLARLADKAYGTATALTRAARQEAKDDEAEA